MGKKRRSSNVGDTDKKRPMKDPDPNSDDYFYDEVDKFHLSKDKILLDPSKEDVECDPEEDLEEEVLALEGASSSDEEDEETINEDTNEDEDEISSEEEDPEKGLPNDKAWGQKKKAFYDADVDDEDVYASDEDAEIAAAEEEEEALILQKRMAGQLNIDDFYAFDQEVPVEEATVKESKVTITKDLSKLSKKERLEILSKQSPELLPLLEEYKEKLSEVKDKYHPLMLMARKGLITNPEGVKFIEMKHQLLLNYLVNISFYLALKASTDNTKGHPVINVLVQHQKIISEMKPLDEQLAPEIEEFLIKHRDDIKEPFSAVQVNDTNRKESVKEEIEEKSCKKRKKLEADIYMDTGMDPLKYYNHIKAQHEKEKMAKKQKLGDLKDGEETDDENKEDGKRMITYEMSKNKGLIRKRRKELKNPRVKHKMKFQKAKIKRKGQVREIQRETFRYGGETTGIKSSLTRSTKIK